jgi:hydrogenase maturation protein HypF
MQRWSVRLSGVVQGVGFRPFVYTTATGFGLTGFVRNEGDAVRVVVEGDPININQFLNELSVRAPAASQITSIQVEQLPSVGSGTFVIESSHDQLSPPTFAPTDLATCQACLAELFESADRRFRYPFLSCAHCGPRFTVIASLPYDRERTTMAAFSLCRDCRQEYEDPADRRFHAQTTACPACGPRLALLDDMGATIENSDPLADSVAALKDGQIVALKGLGGFHLACDARREQTVAELRRRKHRDEKPLAVMVADLATAEELCELSRTEARLLSSPQRPIVLLRRKKHAELADGIAPRQPFVGLMLPYTPLHHLLLHDLRGPLVMTSGNRSDEPIAFDNDDAVCRLGGIADLFLTHNRPIQRRSDDSVVRVVAEHGFPIRRSRGYAPIPIPVRCERSILAVGGDLKSVFAIGRNGQAILSHHLGDLAEYQAFRAFAEAVADYERLFRFQPEVVAHDLHPDYASTRYALERAASDRGIRLVAVQHHHAHLAACLAENGIEQPFIGVAFDGTGYGTDGTIWGGEFLVGDSRAVRRAAHLRPVALPGGDQATREPWRMALSHLHDAGESLDLLADRIEPRSLDTIRTMLDRRLNSPPTSSAGRLFDAVSALIGLRTVTNYEGQAAIELEGLAAASQIDGAYPFAANWPQIDTRPLIAAIAVDIRKGVRPPVIARRFHSTVTEIIVATCAHLREETGIAAVALTGGVFQNAIILEEAEERLTNERFRVYRHRLVPPGDGGLCLGQLMVAAALER